MTNKIFKKILVCGGRDFNDHFLVHKTLNQLRQTHFAEQFCIIQGGAKGADKIADDWAKFMGKCSITVDANWDYYAKGAGSIRNGWMIEFCNPDLVVAFRGGRGTNNMVEKAFTLKIPVIRISDAK